MSRRFPPPLFGVEQIELRSETFVTLVLENEGECDKSAFVDRARERLQKDDGDRYSTSYMRRLVETYAQLGILRQRADGTITVWQFAHDWQAGELEFEMFLWYGIKRSWVLNGKFPEGIDGLRAIHRVLVHKDSPLKRGEIREALEAEYDYTFNDQGLRGFPTLLSELGAARKTADGYQVTDAVDRWYNRFRNVDLLPAFERWLKQEGAHVTPPSDRVKRDLAKYYLYRESGGHGKHRRLFDTFRRDYLKSAAYEDDVSRPTIRRAPKYIEAENQRADLREQIQKQFPEFSGNDLAGLSTETLKRIEAANDTAEASRIKSASGSGFSRADFEQWTGSDRSHYTFPESFDLYEWQQEAAVSWFDSDTNSAGTVTREPETGIARVVTGAGKTVMALEVLRRWLDENPTGVVTILVPTNVLMRQWLEELAEKLNVPADDVGWLGGGHKDGFEDGRRILVGIINSAIKDDYLEQTLKAADVDNHLLVADECHRYTGEMFSNVFDYPRTASLGLSATPLSDPSSDERSTDDELLLRELGSIYYDLTYDEALERKLIPEFRVRYVGFDLTEAERTTYEQFTEKVVDAVSNIETRYGDQLYDLDGPFPKKLQTIAGSVDGPTPAIGDFFRFTQRRRKLIADAIGRQAITLSLLKKTINESLKSIVFQERIEQLERMVAPAETRGRNYRTGNASGEYGDRRRLHEQFPGLERADKALEELFFDADYRPVMYHSGHRNEAWNDFAVEWFDDDGFANVMLSVKALIEGVDVPSADVGIIRVSSGSVRQRIQTLGRVLRTGDDPTDASELYVLYARDTVDENIFRDYEWDEQLSNADVAHLTWDPNDNWLEGDWDPEAPFHECVRPATEEELPTPRTARPIPDDDDLTRGDPYSGPRKGYRFSVDAEGRPFKSRGEGRQFIQHDQAMKIAKYVHRNYGGGEIIVNKASHAVKIDNDQAIYLGVLDPEEFEYQSRGGSITDKPDDDKLGDMV